MARCLRIMAFIAIFTICLRRGLCVEKVFHRDRSESEIIETPGYPEPYPPESHCSWKFEQAAGIWVVVFEDIQIPAGRNQSCVSDYLLITDTKHRHHSSKLCGTLPQKTFVSFGSRIFISFRSDGSAQGRGFRIRVLHQKKRTEWEDKSRGITARKQTQTNTDSIVTALDKETVIFIGLASALLICVLVLLFLVLRMYRHYSYAKTRYTTRNQALDQTQRTENVFMAMMDHRGTNADFHSGVRKFSGPQPKESTCAIELEERKLRVDIPIRTQEMHVMPNQEMVNKSPNVYVQITDSPSPAPLRQAPLDFNGRKLDTDAIKPGQLPLYYKPRDSYQEAKFMGVI